MAIKCEIIISLETGKIECFCVVSDPYTVDTHPVAGTAWL